MLWGEGLRVPDGEDQEARGVLCGRNAVQIVPAKPRTGDLASIRNRLSKLGTVTVSDGVLRFRSKDADLTVFPDGRAVVSGTTDLAAAKTAFSKYIGD